MVICNSCPICFILQNIDRHDQYTPYSEHIRERHHTDQRSQINMVNENSSHHPGGSFKQGKGYLTFNNIDQVRLQVHEGIREKEPRRLFPNLPNRGLTLMYYQHRTRI